MPTLTLFIVTSLRYQSLTIRWVLKSLGIQYDSNRINGAKLLQWEKDSGLDIRAIVAIAVLESSFGN